MQQEIMKWAKRKEFHDYPPAKCREMLSKIDQFNSPYKNLVPAVDMFDLEVECLYYRIMTFVRMEAAQGRTMVRVNVLERKLRVIGYFNDPLTLLPRDLYEVALGKVHQLMMKNKISSSLDKENTETQLELRVTLCVENL